MMSPTKSVNRPETEARKLGFGRVEGGLKDHLVVVSQRSDYSIELTSGRSYANVGMGFRNRALALSSVDCVESSVGARDLGGVKA